MKQKVTFELEVPEGFELTGEYRKPKKGEFYLFHLRASQSPKNFEHTDLPILRKIQTFKAGQVWKDEYGNPILLVRAQMLLDTLKVLFLKDFSPGWLFEAGRVPPPGWTLISERLEVK